MSRLRTALLIVAGLIGIALLAVWLVPRWLDWTRYRATIEAIASATLGQPVSIGGTVSLTLLPEPVLTASQVRVGGGAGGLSVDVNALRLRIAFWPLLGGRMDARELVLRGPDMRIPWPVRPGALRPRAPAWLAAFRARIEDGRLVVGRLALTGIDADLATLDTGAMSASGTGQFSGHSWHFTARLTAVGADGASGLNVTLDGLGDARGLGATFSGQMALDGTLAGTLSSRGPRLAALLPAPPVPFRADGRLSIGNGVAAIDDLALEIDGSPASGAVTLRIAPPQRLDILLVAGRLDLGAWLPALLRTGTTVAGVDIPIGVQVTAAAAPLGGGTLEQLHGEFQLSPTDIVVREAGARLPANAWLRLSGHIARADPNRARFEGDVRFDAPVLRTTVRWLDQAFPGALPARLVSALPETVAQRASLSAHVVAEGGEIALQGLAGTLDQSRLSGSLGLKLGDPPVLTANLSLAQMTLDPWVAFRLPGGVDAELQLNIAHASLAGTTIEALSVDGAFEAGNLRLRRLEGTALGAHFAASGTLGEAGRLSEGVLHIEAPDAAGLSQLMPSNWRATPALWQGPARLDVQAAGPPEALAVQVRLALGDARLEASPIFDLKTGEWSAALALRHPGARRLIAALGLAEAGNLHELPGWLGDGSLALLAHVTAAPGRLVVQQFDLTAATSHATGELVFDVRGAEPLVSGRVGTDALLIPAIDSASDAPLPLGLLHGWRGDLRLDVGRLVAPASAVLRDVSARLALVNGKLRIEQFAARLASGTVTGSVMLDASAQPPRLAAQATLSDAAIAGPLADVPIDLLSGQAEASLSVAANGFSLSTMFATLTGHATLIVRDGIVAGFDLFRLKHAIEEADPKSGQATAEAALQLGSTGFERLDIAATIANGSLAVETGNAVGAAGEAHISGTVDLANRMLDVSVRLQPSLPSPPQVAIHLTGPIDQPNRMPELADLARWIAALVH